MPSSNCPAEIALRPVHDNHPLHSPTSRPTCPHVPPPKRIGDGNEMGVHSPIPGSSVTVHNSLQSSPTDRTFEPRELQSNCPAPEFDGQLEIKTAGATVVILVQIFTSQSMTITSTTRALLSLCMVLELLGMSVAICFVQVCLAENNQRSRTPLGLARHAMRVSTMLILSGIVGLGIALVIETLETSMGTAVTMSGILIFGVVLCISLLGSWVRREACVGAGDNV